jgi:hypothetical protein
MDCSSAEHAMVALPPSTGWQRGSLGVIIS